jgi:hypothetical protein
MHTWLGPPHPPTIRMCSLSKVFCNEKKKLSLLHESPSLATPPDFYLLHHCFHYSQYDYRYKELFNIKTEDHFHHSVIVVVIIMNHITWNCPYLGLGFRPVMVGFFHVDSPKSNSHTSLQLQNKHSIKVFDCKTHHQTQASSLYFVTALLLHYFVTTKKDR